MVSKGGIEGVWELKLGKAIAGSSHLNVLDFHVNENEFVILSDLKGRRDHGGLKMRPKIYEPVRRSRNFQNK